MIFREKICHYGIVSKTESADYSKNSALAGGLEIIFTWKQRISTRFWEILPGYSTG